MRNWRALILLLVVVLAIGCSEGPATGGPGGGGGTNPDAVVRDVSAIQDVHRDAVRVFSAMDKSLQLTDRLQNLAVRLEALSNVEDARVTAHEVVITHNSELRSVLLFQTAEDRSQKVRGGPPAALAQALPEPASPLAAAREEVLLVGNQKILVCSPFHWEFAPEVLNQTLQHIVNIANHDTRFKKQFQIDQFLDQDCSLAKLRTMTEYGTIVLATHGRDDGNGQLFSTTQVISEPTTRRYAELVRADAIVATQVIDVQSVGDIKARAMAFAITPEFIRRLPGTFPNSIVWNGSCEGMKTHHMGEAFLDKGASFYVGFRARPFSSVVVRHGKTFFGRLFVSGTTAREASSPFAPLVSTVGFAGPGYVKYPHDDS